MGVSTPGLQKGRRTPYGYEGTTRPLETDQVQANEEAKKISKSTSASPGKICVYAYALVGATPTMPGGMCAPGPGAPVSATNMCGC